MGLSSGAAGKRSKMQKVTCTPLLYSIGRSKASDQAYKKRKTFLILLIILCVNNVKAPFEAFGAPTEM